MGSVMEKSVLEASEKEDAKITICEGHRQEGAKEKQRGWEEFAEGSEWTARLPGAACKLIRRPASCNRVQPDFPPSCNTITELHNSIEHDATM